MNDKHFSRSEIVAGFRAILPYWIGVAPFGVACALAVTTAGLSGAHAATMSLAVFAGTAQMTADCLLAAGSGPMSVLAATALINMRHFILAASLHGGLLGAPWWKRAMLAFFLNDEAYAQSIQRVIAGPSGASYLLGAGVSLYVCWQLSTATGVVARDFVGDPRRFGLELVFPLSLFVLLWPQLRRRPQAVAAIVAAAASLAARLWLPGNAYLFLGVVAGCFAGVIGEDRTR